MFDFTRAFSSFAAPDLQAAKDFYAGVLGLDVSEQMDGYVLRLELPGDRDTIVYAKADHEPATYTVLNFEVGDIDAAVDALTDAGVAMELYDGFDQDEKGIARGEEGPDIAWFRDPAGNILAVLEA
jgi:catechol 2,3-dioxygenase-like lactoylglutathione lyase family enzyme